MIPYPYVIFDMDGTLLDTLQDLADSVNHGLAALGFPQRSYQEIRRFVGNGIEQLVKLSLPTGTDAQLEAQCLSLFKAHYLTNMHNKTSPYPGIPPMLQSLSNAGIQLGVVSNKFDDALKDIVKTYFGDVFSVVYGARPDLPKKPAPDMLLRCVEEMGGSPAQAIYVGDSDVDVNTAHNAGIPCLAVTWGFRDRSELESLSPSRMADHVDEVLAYLLEG